MVWKKPLHVSVRSEILQVKEKEVFTFTRVLHFYYESFIGNPNWAYNIPLDGYTSIYLPILLLVIWLKF